MVINSITAFRYGFFFNWRMGSGLRLKYDSDLKLSSVGWCLMFVFS